MPASLDPVAPDEAALQCDLVMKGGITSGVVYPRAMVRVARDYRIRSIGGTSVGAIAAVLTAAAEYWRQANPGSEAVARQQRKIEELVSRLDTTVDGVNGWDERQRPDIQAAEADLLAGGVDAPGFGGLYAIPQDIGSDLVGKFQPERDTAGAFRFLIALLEARTPVTRVTTALVRQFHWWRIASAIVIGLFTLAFVRDPLPVAWLLVIMAGAAVAYVAWRRIRSLRAPEPTPDTPDAPNAKRPWRWPVKPLWLAGGLLAALWLTYLQVAIGLGEIGRWVGTHLPLVIVGLILASLVTQADVLRAWLLVRWRSPDPDEMGRRRHLLDVGLLATGVVLGMVLVVTNWQALGEDPHVTAVVVSGMVVGWVLGGVMGLIANFGWSIPRNGLGLCSGMGDARALTPWLTSRINTVAGLAPDAPPLTFGKLAGLPLNRRISLEAIATDLTRGVPLDLPAALHRYRFRPREFQRLFPTSVLSCLGVTEANLVSDELLPFPPAKDIPLVVVARISMSFPVLFSAVPVYFHDGISRRPPLRCLLSDGGIVSNFPIHKFDRSLPGWPTFAIDLIDEVNPAQQLLSQQIWTNPIRVTRDPDIAEGVAARRATEAIPDTDIDTLPEVFSRLVNTARGWIDNSQKGLPGYRERIVGIRLYPGEGGLNLAMGASTIDRLAHRGMYGIHTLIGPWHPDPAPQPDETDAQRLARSQWHQHRWLRYRIIMRSLENIGQEWQRRYAANAGGNGSLPSIADLVDDTRAGDNGAPAGMAYGWKFGVNGMQAAELTDLFNAFATRAPGLLDDNGKPVAGVFDQPVAPEVEPKSLMMPPFE